LATRHQRFRSVRRDECLVTAIAAIYSEAEVTLTSVGSGAAQTALWGDIDCEDKPVEAICAQTEVEKTVWGIGDAPIESNVYEENPFLLVQQFPASVSAIAVVHYNEVTPVSSTGTTR
jgi:hypothetical protein